MRKNVVMAGLALAVVLPSAAMAQETCEQRAQDRVAGTVVGGLAGALLGGAVSGHGHKTTGAVVGGLAGAVIGNQVAKGPQDCRHAYGWYDNDGRWHANAVDPGTASGYYDRNGAWVDGRPAHYHPAQYGPAQYGPAPPPPPPPPPPEGGELDAAFTVSVALALVTVPAALVAVTV